MTVRNSKFLSVRAMLVLLIVMLVGIASPARSDYAHMRNEVALFQSFLQSRPNLSAELRANPKLVNNKKYLDKHEELSKFLKRHPNVKRELVNHPKRIFGNYYRTEQAQLNHNG